MESKEVKAKGDKVTAEEDLKKRFEQLRKEFEEENFVQLKDLLLFENTSSRHIDPDRLIYVGWPERTCSGKFLCIIYQMFKWLETTFWFYFTPFLAIYLSYLVPYYANK